MKKFLISIVFILVCVCCFAFAVDDQSAQNTSGDVYYPVVFTSEWKTLSRNERVAACRLSQEEISEMNTTDFITKLLQNPFMVDLYAFDSFELGYQHLKNDFPEISALESRADLGSSLIDVYQAIPVATSKDESNNILPLSFLEILIAQPDMTENLSKSDIEAIAEIAMNKHCEKVLFPSINGGTCDTFYSAISEVPQSNLALAVNLSVYTPKGSAVPVINKANITDWTNTEITALNNQTSTAYPSAIKLRNPTKKYNCHSYAWYSTSSSNHYWMNNPAKYMSDGSYTNTSSTSFNNKIYWKSGSSPVHSGIIASYVNGGPYFACTSKWGELGLYNHPVVDCPYGGTKSYWKR